VNLPNFLTFVRFMLIPLYIFVFMSDYKIIAFLLVVLAGITDVLDGYIARKRGQVTPIGAMLDPLADKCMMITVIVSLVFTNMIPWLAAVFMFIRDAGMILGSAIFHFRGKRTVPANTMGKLTTVLVYFAFLFIFFEVPFAIPFLWIVIVFSFVTSMIYIVLFRRLNQGVKVEVRL
jgi:cardiolipin synthase (CMP-forming)